MLSDKIKEILLYASSKYYNNHYVLKNLYFNLYYSQEGEDIILRKIFEGKTNGFYIDIGAHHPIRFSNTYYLYQEGWSGINIDPIPGIMERFNKIRPRDINLEIGISEKEQILTYNIFNEQALNTFNIEEAKLKDGSNSGLFYITEKKEVRTYPLSDILNQYIKENQQIDFLSIDVEGLDLEVLMSNDWTKYRPHYILVEELRTDIENIIKDSKIFAFLKEHNYSLLYRTYNTSFYKKND